MIGGVWAIVVGAFVALVAVSPLLLAGGIALHLLKVVAEARAWHGIVRHAHPGSGVAFPTTLVAFVGSIGAGAVLPARVGDAFRVGVVRRRLTGSSVTTIVSTIVAETVIEVAFAAVVIGAAVIVGNGVWRTAPIPLHGHPLLEVATGSVGIGLLGIGVALRRRLAHLLEQLRRGCSILTAPRELGRVLGWKMVAWGLRLLAVYVFLTAFHLPSTPSTVLVVVAAQSVAALVPFLPGNAGAQQAVLAAAFVGVVSTTSVLGFGVGMQAATSVADVGIGVIAVIAVARGRDRGWLRALFAGRGRAQAA